MLALTGRPIAFYRKYSKAQVTIVNTESMIRKQTERLSSYSKLASPLPLELQRFLECLLSAVAGASRDLLTPLNVVTVPVLALGRPQSKAQKSLVETGERENTDHVYPTFKTRNCPTAAEIQFLKNE